MNDFPILGFDIGGTKIAACLATGSGRILASKRIESAFRPPDDVLPEMVSTGYELLKSAGLQPDDLRVIGIDAPAPMDIPTGRMLAPTNMKTWTDVPVRNYLAEKFGVETFFDNDANAGVLAEWFFGAGKGCKHLIYLTMSTGIGGGIIVNGHLVYGGNYLAGEMGHVVLDINGPLCNCGLYGCYEAFCGGRSVAKRMQKELADSPEHSIVRFAGGIDKVDFIALEKAVCAKDEYALKLWDEICMRNAQALGIFINIFNPEMIVLGTIAWAAGDLFMKPVKNYLEKFSWHEMRIPLKLMVSALGREIAEYSGICVALNGLYEEGKWLLPWERK